MSTPLHLSLAGHELFPQPERALWWPAASALLVADLHLGKGEAMFAHGAPLSPEASRGILHEQLARLSACAARLGPARVLVLGDLLHAPAGITDDLVARVAAWRQTFAPELCLIPGNHDRHLHRVLDAWRIGLMPEEVVERGVLLRHDPRVNAPRRAPSEDHPPVIGGHVHPAVRLGNRGETLKLPCFWRTGSTLVLPAFTLFASGVVIDVFRGDDVVAVAGPQLVRLAGTAATAQSRGAVLNPLTVRADSRS
jgi:hypothetical protein